MSSRLPFEASDQGPINSMIKKAKLCTIQCVFCIFMSLARQAHCTIKDKFREVVIILRTNDVEILLGSRLYHYY